MVSSAALKFVCSRFRFDQELIRPERYWITFKTSLRFSFGKVSIWLEKTTNSTYFENRLHLSLSLDGFHELISTPVSEEERLAVFPATKRNAITINVQSLSKRPPCLFLTSHMVWCKTSEPHALLRNYMDTIGTLLSPIQAAAIKKWSTKKFLLSICYPYYTVKSHKHQQPWSIWQAEKDEKQNHLHRAYDDLARIFSWIISRSNVIRKWKNYQKLWESHPLDERRKVKANRKCCSNTPILKETAPTSTSSTHANPFTPVPQLWIPK